jgi:hypothetical protein
MGKWLGIPIKFERIYTDYEVEGGTPPPAGSSYRPAGTAHRRRNDGEREDSTAYRARRDSVRAVRRACLDRAHQREEVRACWRASEVRDTTLEVVIPRDTLSLLASETLGPPILAMGDLITESEIKGLADAINVLPRAPLGSRVALPHGVGALLQNARYNRVEALSLGISGSAQTGRFVVDGLGRIGLADGVPNAELGFSLTGRSSRFRFGGYRRLASMNPDTKPFGVVNSIWGVLAQRDDGEYFRSHGIELIGQHPETGWWSWRLYAERQKAASVGTSFSLPHLFDGSNSFRPNVVADRADQFGASLTLRGNRPVSRTMQFGGEATLDAAGGDYRFGRGSATVRAIVTPKALLAMALELSAGSSSSGTLPLQSRFYLGGPATLRGYDGAVTAGASYWRGRIEVGNSFPAFRLTAFTDVGWAGRRADFWSGKPLIGSGIGGSILDGLIRLDLSRGMRAPQGWRFDLYFDGRL